MAEISTTVRPWPTPGFAYYLGRHAISVRRLSDGDLCISIGDSEYAMPIDEANELVGMINAVRKSMADSKTTARVRILVMIDPDGKWEASGSHLWSDKQAIDEVGNCCGDLGRPPWGYHWVEANIPIPVEQSDQAIEGDIMEAESDVA